MKAEAVTLKDTSKSKIDEATQTFTVEGVSDGVDPDSFNVSGTAIFGSQSVTLSSIIKSLSPIDADEQLEITLELSQEFINVAGSSGFYDNSSNQYVSDPYFICSEAQISSYLSNIEIRTADEQPAFSINASAASDNPDAVSAAISKQIFISNTPLSTPELVASDGSALSSSFTLTRARLLYLTLRPR